jgi:serine/threonine protein kinase
MAPSKPCGRVNIKSHCPATTPLPDIGLRSACPLKDAFCSSLERNDSLKPPPFDIGAVIENHFRIERELGRGGFGSVYTVRDTRTNEVRAIKISHSMDVQYLQAEIDAITSLANPLVGVVYEYGRMKDGRAYLIRDVIDGPTLSELLPLKENRVAAAVQLGRRLSNVLALLHDKRIVHRDIKPANVVCPLFNARPVFAKAQLIDFGICLRMNQRSVPNTLSAPAGNVSGTVYYMAPEVAVGRPQTGAADIYSLGVTLHEILYGTVPFAGERVQHFTAPGGFPRLFFGPFVARKITEDVATPSDDAVLATLRELLTAMLRLAPSRRPKALECLAEFCSCEITLGIQDSPPST